MLTAHQAATTAADLLRQAAALHERADQDAKQSAAFEARGRRDEAALLSRSSVLNRSRAFELSDQARELGA